MLARSDSDFEVSSLLLGVYAFWNIAENTQKLKLTCEVVLDLLKA